VGVLADSKLGVGTLVRAVSAALGAAACALAASATPAAAAPEATPIATFHYTGGPRVFTVPPEVTYLTFDVTGGRGGFPSTGAAPGPGGETIAGLDVNPGQKLTIWVGENAGGAGGWGYTCGGDKGKGTEDPEGAFDGGGGGGSSAVTDGEWTQGAGSCSASTRPPAEPLIVGGGGGGGGGRESIPFSRLEGGAGGAGGKPAEPGFQGQGDSGPSPGGCVGCGVGNTGGHGATESEGANTIGGGGGGGGGYTPEGKGGGGGGRRIPSNAPNWGGAGGAGGISFASGATSSPVYTAGPLKSSGVVTISTVHQQGFGCTGHTQHPEFPQGVQWAHVTVEGAAGGTRTGDSKGPAGKGGHGGIVNADLARLDWDSLSIEVGCAGSDHGDGGGYGYGSGGRKGTANGHEGDDGSGGGGGSGIELGGAPLVVAGGGGGGGGGTATLIGTLDGGNGGNGGPRGDHASDGHGGEGSAGGSGGCPGADFKHKGKNGGAGGGSSTVSDGGGGGGGGGGWAGGCGGEGGNAGSGPGGGGGGGGSYALPHSSTVVNAHYSTSGGVGTNGTVVFSYVISEPAHLSPASGSGQQAQIGATFAKRLVAQVFDQEGHPMEGALVSFGLPSNLSSATGRFPGGAELFEAKTDSRGLVTSPPLTANLVPGSWQAEAVVGFGVPPVEFSLTNTVRPTATGLKASANPALAGEPITFTATVKGTSGGPTPSGSVQFTSDGSALGAPVPLSGGAAQKAAELPLGSHTVEAVFQPNQGFQASRAELTENVEKATSATKVTSSDNPSGFGDAVAFTAHISHSGAQPTGGTVQFEVDGAPFGAPVTVSGGTATSGSTSALTVAAHEVVAKYSGDASIAASEGKLTQSVGPDATATELDASANPSVYGQAVIYTATVKAQGSDTPTGSITFLVDGAQACEATLAGGSASCEPAAALAPGSHEIRAEYAGDADFDPSHGILAQNVGKAQTATDVSADVEAPRFGQPVTFSAAVSTLAPGGGVPTGVVQFFLGDQPLGAPVNISGGVATTPPIATLPVGVDAVSASYLGDANHAGSEETLFEEVAQAATTTTLTSSANPTHFGVPVTFTARVTPTAPAGGEPGGSVRFSLDGTAICDVPLDSAGEAKCDAPTLYAGDHDVSASYSGEADFEPSDGMLTESVVRVPSLTVASTSASRIDAGQPVTLSAEVGGLPPETPAGTVTFSAGSQVLGTEPVQQSEVGEARAELETTALSAGSHEIVARYNGDDAIEPSSSLPITQVVTGDAKPQPAPAACAARNVRARVLVFRGRNEIRLVARNRADAPATVKVRFTDERGRGKPKSLGTVRHQFSGEGMHRVVRKLPAAEMRRLRQAGDGISASIAVTGAPGYCAEESAHPLSVRRLVSGQRVWFQDGSAGHELPPNSR